MAKIVRGTTPTLTFTLPFEPEELAAFWVTFKQLDRVVINKEKGDNGVSMVDKTLVVTLSQVETLRLEEGECKIQIRGRDREGKAAASIPIDVEVMNVLKNGVI